MNNLSLLLKNIGIESELNRRRLGVDSSAFPFVFGDKIMTKFSKWPSSSNKADFRFFLENLQ